MLSDRGRGLLRAARVAFPVAVFLCAVLYFLSERASCVGFPLDDGWIHQVYARSVASGRGFQYNPGSPETGASSPLWVVVTAPAHWLAPFGTGVVVLAVKLVGIILGGFAVWAMQRVSATLTRSEIAAAIAASLFALEPRLAFSAVSGMEVTLLVALWIGGSYALTRRRWWIGAILIGLTPVARPEAVVLVASVVVVLVVAWREVGRRTLIALSLPLSAPSLCWGLYCRWVSGHWLPSTFYAKAEQSSPKIQLAWQVLSEHGWLGLFMFPLGIIGAFLFVSRRHAAIRVVFPLLVVAPVLYALGVMASRTIVPGGYYWERWLDPAGLVLVAFACLGCGATIVSFGRSQAVGLKVVVAVTVAGLLVSLGPLSGSIAERKQRLASDCRAIDRINVATGLWIRENVPMDAVVGVNDAGAIRFFGDHRTLDLLGVNHHEIATGRRRAIEVFEEVDWLAIFPSVFASVSRRLEREFEPVMVISIPPEEYTICGSPGQTAKVIYRRKEVRSEHPIDIGDG